jgi:predicted transcriptional regulator
VRQIVETVYDFDDDSDGYGITRARLMHEVMLSNAKLREYLVLLTAHRFLSYKPEMRRYNITEKGLRFLDIYYKLRDIMSEEEEKGIKRQKI